MMLTRINFELHLFLNDKPSIQVQRNQTQRQCAMTGSRDMVMVSSRMAHHPLRLRANTSDSSSWLYLFNLCSVCCVLDITSIVRKCHPYCPILRLTYTRCCIIKLITKSWRVSYRRLIVNNIRKVVFFSSQLCIVHFFYYNNIFPSFTQIKNPL